MKKSIFLFFAAILCAMSVSAANMKGGEVLYLKPNSNWTQANAWFAIYLCNGTSGATWVKMTKSGDYYMATVPAGDYKNVIFCRMNNANTTKLDWSNKWNQSGDLSFDQIKNLCTINSGQWDCGENVTWSTYQPVSNASLTSSVTDIFVGAQATLIPSLSTNTNVNTIKSIDYSINPATGASITGNTFTATAEGSYTIKATVTYYPNGCTKLASGLKTAPATTTIVAEVPDEETHDVTVSYLCGSTKVADPTTVNTVGVETPVKITAPEIAKYTFANWTLGADVATTDALTSNEINITTKAGGSDFTLVANYEKAKLTYTVTVPAGTENCYLVGAMNGWDEKNPYEMTKQGENVFTTTLEGVATTDEYKYLSQKGTWDYSEVGDNRTWTANDVVTAWKDPLATNVYLVGNMFANWDKTPDKEFRKTTKDATTASIVVALDANKDYELKVRRGDDWTSCTSKITNTVTGLQFSSSNNDNCKMKTTVAGDYTFTWTISSSKLDVTYPAIYAITATANNPAMGTVTGAGNYGKGSTATLTATPNDGYLFVNWTKGSEEVSTDATYSFKVEEAVELVANFEAAAEEVHNVTVSYVCGGNKIADDQTIAAVGETTAKTVEAPAIFGYTFASWTLGEDVTSANELTSNTIDINIVAGGSDYTLTANYTEIPKVTVYFVNNKKWSKVQVYGWKDGEAQGIPGWPGKNITENTEAEQVAGFDVYSYSVVPGSYDNIIFNNKEGDSGEQTETYKWTNGKYYYMGAAENYAGGTAEEVETALGSIVTYDYYIAEDGKLSGKTDWSSKSIGLTDDDSDGIYEKTFTEQAVGTYLMKVTNGTWVDGNVWGFSDIEGAYEEVKAATSDNNIQITLTVATTFTVKFNSTTKKITFEGLTPNTTSLTYRVEVPEGTEKCFIAGPCGVWAFQEMTREGETDIFTITIVGAKETDEYKYTCQADWAYAEVIDGGGNRTAWTELDKVEKWAEPAKCYLMGNGDWVNGVEMEYDSENGQYILLAHYISAPFKFKMGDEWSDKVENNTANGVTWTDEDEDGNYDINLPVGYYDFFFKKDSKKVYIEAATPYTRDVRQGYYGTICLPTAGQMVGASIFEIAYKDASKIYFDEIVSGKMEAGVPYIFLPNEGITTLKVFYTEMAVVAAGSKNGLVGSYTQKLLEADGNDYILLNNQYCEVIGEAYVGANRAYFQLGSIPTPAFAPVLAPGARRVSMGMAGQNTATGVDQVQGDNVPTKMIINGQLFIFRGEKMYDAQGKLVK